MVAIDASNVALVLLAAGRSERFGARKMEADLNGLPLGLHAAQLFAGFGFAQHLVVVGTSELNFDANGFVTIVNPAPEQGQSSSLRLGICAVTAKACMIALADMPFVTVDHVNAMLAQFDGDRLASSCDTRIMPPALFGERHYAPLAALTGDQGARILLRDAPHVVGDRKCLADIDHPDDLAEWIR